MRIRVGRWLDKGWRYAKKNPEIALMVVGGIAPGIVAKAAPIIAAATRKPEQP